jgi:hypothetical protein
MTGHQVISALREKRVELSTTVTRLEQNLARHRADLTHLDATMKLFLPSDGSTGAASRPDRSQISWFSRGECLRLIYDVLRDASAPMTARAVTERIAQMKKIEIGDERQRDLLQRTILSSLNRAKETIERLDVNGVIKWRVCQAALARCQ